MPEKTNEITAIPVLLDHLAETEATRRRARHHRRHGMSGRDRRQDRRAQGRFPAAAEGQSADAGSRSRRLFRHRAGEELVSKTTVEKGHGRIETRIYTASKVVDWIGSEKSYPGQPRFKDIKTILHVVNRTEYADRCTFDTRLYISSAPLDIERLAAGSRGHWGVESMHWLLDVEFKDDLSRYRAGHGAKNMAIVRRFALGLVRANKEHCDRREAGSIRPTTVLADSSGECLSSEWPVCAISETAAPGLGPR